MGALEVIAIALFPGLARYAYAPGFESPCGAAKFVAVRAVLTFVAFQTKPRAVARQRLWDATWNELSERLGRQPTPDEFRAGWREAKRAARRG